MLDKTKSYKIVGGKFVERTPEELARLDQRKAEQAAREPVKQRMPRTKGHFVKVTVAQIAKLHELGSAACWLCSRSCCMRTTARTAGLSSW